MVAYEDCNVIELCSVLTAAAHRLTCTLGHSTFATHINVHLLVCNAETSLFSAAPMYVCVCVWGGGGGQGGREQYVIED